ncbi:MAG: hypothetical protein M3P83_09140 [Actinomycetota bacterium]|nr:hypothetical protein [Actinomycetota bacterium]
MSDTIVIPVPERLLSVYAVPTAAPPDEPVVVSESGITVDLVPVDQAPLPPPALLRAMGAGGESLARLGAATHATLVRSVSAVTFPPPGEFAAYTTATVVAAATNGLVIDTVIPRVVERPRAVDGDFRLADWVVLPHSVENGLLWFTSKGMGRFGLPEVQSRQVPERLTNAWGAVLTGMAQVLLADHARAQDEAPGRAFRELPAEHEVSLRDIATGYNDQARFADGPGLDTSVRFRVEYDPATVEGADSFFTVLPPADFAGTPAHWVEHVVRRLFAAATR